MPSTESDNVDFEPDDLSFLLAPQAPSAISGSVLESRFESTDCLDETESEAIQNIQSFVKPIKIRGSKKSVELTPKQELDQAFAEVVIAQSKFGDVLKHIRAVHEKLMVIRSDRGRIYRARSILKRLKNSSDHTEAEITAVKKIAGEAFNQVEADEIEKQYEITFDEYEICRKADYQARQKYIRLSELESRLKIKKLAAS